MNQDHTERQVDCRLTECYVRVMNVVISNLLSTGRFEKDMDTTAIFVAIIEEDPSLDDQAVVEAVINQWKKDLN